MINIKHKKQKVYQYKNNLIHIIIRKNKIKIKKDLNLHKVNKNKEN